MTASSAQQYTDQRMTAAATEADTLRRVRALEISPAVRYGRNLLDNGAMRISQRGTSINPTTNGAVCLPDRFMHYRSTVGGVWSQAQLSGAANAPAGLGITTCARVQCVTAPPALTAPEWLIFGQRVEGLRAQELLWGTALGRPAVLSFWTRSNVVGPRPIEIESISGGGYRIGRTYTVTVANEWQRKSLLIDPLLVGGAIADATSVGMYVHWWLAAGSAFTSGGVPNAAWALQDVTSNTRRAVGITQLNGTGNWQDFTACQLEVGITPTPFENRLATDEYRPCRRHFQRWYYPPLVGAVNAAMTGVARAHMPLPEPMRAVPTAVLGGPVMNVHDGVASPTVNSIVGNYSQRPDNIELDFAVGAGFVVARVAAVLYQNSPGGYIDLTAEM